MNIKLNPMHHFVLIDLNGMGLKTLETRFIRAEINDRIFVVLISVRRNIRWRRYKMSL